MSATDRERLRIETEAGEGQDLPATGTLIVGSSAERAGFVVGGHGVEDAHCVIGRVKDGGWAIKDLGSAQGSYVNGERVGSARLRPGDVVVIGSTSLFVRDPDEPDEERAPVAKSSEGLAEEPVESLGGYRIEGVLGRGAMGRVVRAVQESLDRPVALKILSAELAADREFVLSFHSEARAAAALSHPNVVVVHDVGEEKGQHYLVMEYMPGGSLEDRIARDGSIPWRETLDILHEAAAGLTYAEEQGIVHRDIKPANLMIAASGVVKIADLGLATAISEQGDVAAGRKVFGTPHFISPEQAQGLAVDHRSDLYSLGATAYRLLTGRTPFEGATAKEIVRARFHSDPPRPREITPGIPAEVEHLVLRSMARRPEARFASAAELSREVDRIRLHADHGAPRAAEPAPRAPSRTPIVLGVLGAVLLVGGIGAAALFLLPDEGATDASGTKSERSPIVSPVGAASPVAEPDAEFFGGGEPAEPEVVDEEADLRALELRAKVAYLEIPEDYSREDRIAALSEIVEDFAPTSVANDARVEITSLEGELDRVRTLAARRSEEIEQALDGMRDALGWPPRAGALEPVATYRERIASYTVPTALATNPEFRAARAELESEFLSEIETVVAKELTRADELARAGEFAQLGELLAELDAALAIGAEEEDEPAELATLRDARDRVRARLEHLDTEEAEYRFEVARADARRLASAVGHRSGVLNALFDVRLDQLAARLSETQGSLTTPRTRTVAESLVTRLQRADSALDLLTESYDAGEWRRRTVAIPSGRLSEARETVGANDDGLLVDERGTAQLVPWSAFGADPDGIAALYRGRLTRRYSSDEQARIVSLLTFVAVAHVLAPATLALDPARTQVFLPSEAAALTDPFAVVDEWIADSGESGPENVRLELERERAAAQLLGDALLASAEGAWTQAVSTLEYLLGDYADTLVVVALSNGTSVALLAPPDDAIAAAGDEAPGSDE